VSVIIFYVIWNEIVFLLKCLVGQYINYFCVIYFLPLFILIIDRWAVNIAFTDCQDIEYSVLLSPPPSHLISDNIININQTYYALIYLKMKLLGTDKFINCPKYIFNVQT